MTPTNHTALAVDERRSHSLGSGLLLGIALLISGCVTPWERSSLMGGRETTIDNVQGPTERRLRDVLWRKEKEEYIASNGSLKPLPGTDDYLKAEELYDQEQYEDAAKAFKKVAKKYKKSEIREDALFMEAESAYNLGHYAKAQDRYSMLLKDYPSTRHLDDVSQRLFEIARMWLDFPEQASITEVSQVNYDNFGAKLPAVEPAKKQSWGASLWPNMTDKSRPIFDPEGNGVGALRLIWLNDPTGPLADDSLMLAASHYARAGNFIEADRHYTLLREEYPNSPHVQNAFVLGSHVKLMSYEGPAYDEKSLNDAEQLKESILRLYPEIEDRERIQKELNKIEFAKAEREWQQVVFHERKGNARAQAVYCHLVLQRFPQTPFAEMARERLVALGPEYSNGRALLNPQPDQPKYRRTFAAGPPPLTNTPSSMRPSTAKPQPQPVEEPEPETEPAPAPRRFLPPWGGSDEEPPQKLPEPESPGDEFVPEEPERTVAGEAAPGEKSEPTGNRWLRMPRFTPPRRLFPAGDAKPINESAREQEVLEMDEFEKATEDASGSAAL